MSIEFKKSTCLDSASGFAAGFESISEEIDPSAPHTEKMYSKLSEKLATCKILPIHSCLISNVKNRSMLLRRRSFCNPLYRIRGSGRALDGSYGSTAGIDESII